MLGRSPFPQQGSSIFSQVPSCVSFAITGSSGVGSTTVSGASGMDLTLLERTVHHFLEAGLSESTKKVYRAGWNRYMSFVRAFSLPATPVSPENVTLFVAFLGSEGLSVSTIESYLAAIVACSGLVRPFLHSTLLPLTSYEGTPSRHPAGPSPAGPSSHAAAHHSLLAAADQVPLVQ